MAHRVIIRCWVTSMDHGSAERDWRARYSGPYSGRVPIPDSSHVAGLAEWIGALRAELRKAQDVALGEDIRFAVGPVELELVIASTREGAGSGEIKFWVLGAGGSARVAKESTQRVTLTLTPESPSGSLKVGDQLDQPPD